MTKKSFEIGQRVKCYGIGVKDDGEIGEIYKYGIGSVVQVYVGTSLYSFHIKQLRRLKPKRVAREWWINETRWRKDQPLSDQDVMSFAEWFENINGGYIITVPPEDTKGWLHVVEKFEKVKP